MKKLYHHHTAYAKGYISRKGTQNYTEQYNGKYGKGEKRHYPCGESTRYHLVEYWIEIEE